MRTYERTTVEPRGQARRSLEREREDGTIVLAVLLLRKGSCETPPEERGSEGEGDVPAGLLRKRQRGLCGIRMSHPHAAVPARSTR